MCKRALIRVWKTADTVQELKDLIGDDIVINDSYKGQTIKPDQCLCCVDMEATAKLHSFDHEIIDGDFWFKTWAIDRMSVKFHFPGPVCEVFSQKVGIPDEACIANGDLIAAAPEMLEALEDALATCEHDMQHILDNGRLRSVLRAAIAKAKGEGNG